MVDAELVLVLELLRHPANAGVHGGVGHEGGPDEVGLGEQNHQVAPLQIPVQTPLVVPELVLRLLVLPRPLPEGVGHVVLELPKAHVRLVGPAEQLLQVEALPGPEEFDDLEGVKKHVVSAEVPDELLVDLQLAEVVFLNGDDEALLQFFVEVRDEAAVGVDDATGLARLPVVLDDDVLRDFLVVDLLHLLEEVVDEVVEEELHVHDQVGRVPPLPVSLFLEVFGRGGVHQIHCWFGSPDLNTRLLQYFCRF